jgi:hypothetical protein
MSFGLLWFMVYNYSFGIFRLFQIEERLFVNMFCTFVYTQVRHSPSPGISFIAILNSYKSVNIHVIKYKYLISSIQNVLEINYSNELFRWNDHTAFYNMHTYFNDTGYLRQFINVLDNIYEEQCLMLLNL